MSQHGEDRSDAHELCSEVFSAPHDSIDREWRTLTPTLPIRDEHTHAQDDFVRAQLVLLRQEDFPLSSAEILLGGRINMDEEGQQVGKQAKTRLGEDFAVGRVREYSLLFRVKPPLADDDDEATGFSELHRAPKRRSTQSKASASAARSGNGCADEAGVVGDISGGQDTDHMRMGVAIDFLLASNDVEPRNEGGDVHQACESANDALPAIEGDADLSTVRST